MSRTNEIDSSWYTQFLKDQIFFKIKYLQDYTQIIYNDLFKNSKFIFIHLFIYLFILASVKQEEHVLKRDYF